MCGCFYIGFIDFMLKGKRLLDYTNLLSPNDYDRNDKLTKENEQIIPCYFRQVFEIWKNIWGRRINWNIKNILFNWKYIITQKMCLKKT